MPLNHLQKYMQVKKGLHLYIYIFKNNHHAKHSTFRAPSSGFHCFCEIVGNEPSSLHRFLCSIEPFCEAGPQILQESGDLSKHQWSGTVKKWVLMNFRNLFLYSMGEIIVGSWFLGTTSEDFTQFSSCLSHVYCLR